MFPPAEVSDPLVEGKQVGDDSSYSRVDREQFTREMTPGENSPVCRTVESMIVSGCEIDHHLVQDSFQATSC